ncbi:MAG TPA: hypothetical protein PLA43_17030 [Bryobacteraceae bacterium]|nr:hypothetical protein [Bryobacteraceae bacterium]HPU73657.1 hypothetical protein [Bryobacteraceae bacterium]
MGQAAIGQNTGAVAAGAKKTGAAARYVWPGATILLLTLLTFVQFPGRTFLQSDTQIYMPILERLGNPALFAQELLARHPHTSFTIYDESALVLSRLTGLSLETVLLGEQFVFRALGILGIFLLACALRLSTRLALLAAATFSLGATIAGPTVLSIEYEPVPRAFAVPLLLLAIGLAAHGRDLGAGAAASVAFLYHPPSVLPFWIVYFALTLWPSKPSIMRRRILGLIPILVGVIALFALSRLQTGVSEPMNLFGRVDPELERLQRMRAPYNWLSMWQPQWFLHYPLLWLASLLAYRRIRDSVSQDVRFFLIGLPLLGMLSMPATWLLLEKWKWILIPQLQPARTLLFVTVLASLMAVVAAVRACERRRWWEAILWFTLVFAIPTKTYVPGLITEPGRATLLAPALALLAGVAVWAELGKRRWATASWAAAALLPFFLIPWAGGVVNYPRLHTPEIDSLAEWARANTSQDAVFLFPDAGRELYPGIFRSKALRAVYVDWKGGGQVNFMREFAMEWQDRWQDTGAGRFRPELVPSFRARGIDYFVLKSEHALKGRTPVWSNSRFLVYEPW